jgi:hypothetical protein
MSTIKSSSEHLVLNADGANKSVKFQSDGVEKASINSAGLFTSTTIDATKLTGALPVIDGSNLTGVDAATVSTTAPTSPTAGDMWFNSSASTISTISSKAMGVWSGTEWNQLSNVPFSASGGTITISGGYKIHKFTSSGTFIVAGSTGSVEYLVIAGGGGGGNGSNPGGAGGAGGYRSSVVGESSGGGVLAESKLSLSEGNYTVTVGAGGSPNNNGTNSVFSTITTIGGGSGSPTGVLSGNSGGSGGGASYSSTGGPGTSGQGYAGGDAGGYSGGIYATGGGGGAAAAGDAGNVSTGKSGNGGNGVSSSITGSAVARAGGGGGSMYTTGTEGFGGTGGGGAGGSNSSNASNATVNTGSGGGGYANAATGGSGGSGIVIIRYAV